VKVNVPVANGVPVIVSVVELAVDVNASPVGSAPAEIAHVAAITSVMVPELYATPRYGYASVVGEIPPTTRV
jgi:hypothetical protein